MEIDTKEERLVRRVNELFHDYTRDEYEGATHAEMIHKERERWNGLRKHFEKNKPMVILDIGSGSGFVPLSISQYLKKEDKLICTDVSQKMLNNLETKLVKQNFRCRFSFFKLGDKKLPFKNGSVDVVTVNSVLHHIANTQFFLKEIDRILKNKGILIIGHEPNINFYKNNLLKFNNFFIRAIFSSKDIIKDMALIFGIEESLIKFLTFINKKQKNVLIKRENLAYKINSTLKKEKLINKELSHRAIMALVDYKTKGFDPRKLTPYKILHIETYNHLRGIARRFLKLALLKKFNYYLQKKYPFDGRTFLAVYQKVL